MPETSPASSSVGSLQEWGEAYLKAWNDHDPSALVPLFGARGTYQDPGLPEPLTGGEAVSAYAAALVAAFPDVAFEQQQLLLDGDRAAAVWRMTGTYRGMLPGLPAPTGATVDISGVDVIVSGPDGIVQLVGYFDQFTLLAQLGVQLPVGGDA